jgi:hypothetical protein
VISNKCGVVRRSGSFMSGRVAVQVSITMSKKSLLGDHASYLPATIKTKTNTFVTQSNQFMRLLICSKDTADELKDRNPVERDMEIVAGQCHTCETAVDRLTPSIQDPVFDCDTPSCHVRRVQRRPTTTSRCR